MKTLNVFSKLAVLALAALMVVSCGEPKDAESINQGGTMGGYSVVSKTEPFGYAQDLIVKDDICYIAQGEAGLAIFDVSDKEAPEMISSISEDVRGYSSKIAMKDSAIYLVAGSFGGTVLSVSDPGNPLVTYRNLDLKPSKHFHVMGDYMVSSNSEQGFQMASIEDPLQPDVRKSTSTDGYARAVTHSPDTTMLLVAEGEMGMAIYDISDFQEGWVEYEQLLWIDTEGYANDIISHPTDDVAFLACGTGGLQIIDYSDTANVHVTGGYDGAGYAKELLIDGDLIYMTVETYGLQVIDVSDITNPVLVGAVETEYALGVDFDDEYIYVADENEGLIIIAKP